MYSKINSLLYVNHFNNHAFFLDTFSTTYFFCTHYFQGHIFSAHIFFLHTHFFYPHIFSTHIFFWYIISTGNFSLTPLFFQGHISSQVMFINITIFSRRYICATLFLPTNFIVRVFFFGDISMKAFICPLFNLFPFNSFNKKQILPIYRLILCSNIIFCQTNIYFSKTIGN